MLKIFNTLTRKKEPVQTGKPNELTLYVCGMTVYDYCHIGHARVMVVFDMIVRYLREIGYTVHYIRNITDVDDKIIRRAQEKQMSMAALTEQFIDAMTEDAASLFVLPPDQEPRATQHIAEMIELIQRLIEAGYAYVSGNGDVCYRVAQFNDYGKLSNKSIEGLRVGARVEASDSKADPLDFVLWKLAKPNEPAWSSPWKAGRPGWHIECSAMSMHCLGETIDWHGGGADLQFPHHENEIAQSEAATHKPFANQWLHVGFVTNHHEKMSKSLNNFFTIRAVLSDYAPEVVRYFLLTSHYRSPLNYSDQALACAKASLTRLYLALRDQPVVDCALKDDPYTEKFHHAMQDDFNTPEAFAVLFELAHAIHRGSDPKQTAYLAARLRQLGQVLGLLQDNQFLQQTTRLTPDEIAQCITARNEARVQRDFAKADQIRDMLLARGILLEDSPNGTTWRPN